MISSPFGELELAEIGELDWLPSYGQNGRVKDLLASDRAVDRSALIADSLAMVAIRTILAALIAVSVAAFPASGGAAVATNSLKMSALGHAEDMPCCAPDDCKDPIACAVKCFNFPGAVFPAMVPLRRIVDAALPIVVQGALHEYVASPPTHPPPNLTAFRA